MPVLAPGALANLLNETLDFRQAKQAESQLRSLETEPGFAQQLLQVVGDPSVPLATRQAGAVLFKNLVLRRWTDEDGNYLLPPDDVLAVRSQIIEFMIALPPPLQAQIGEAVSLIADSDFPERWPDLVPTLVARMGPDNPKINNGVLTVAHSIFKRWRPLFRSDALFLEIKLVLGQFSEPYLQLMVETDRRIKQTGGADSQWLETMNVLVKLYYDLNCQDVPEFFEDHLPQFMGILHSYLSFQPVVTSSDDDEPGVIESIRTGICEVLVLYAQRFEEGLDASYVESVWTLLTQLGPQSKYDLVINRGLAFLTAMVAAPRFTPMFSSEQVLQQVVENIVVPNMALRPTDEELFEDDPVEWVRRDVEGADGDTRRHAATAFLRELAGRLEADTTRVVMRYVEQFMAEYHAAPDRNWQAKVTATQLFGAIAAKGNVTSAGVSTTNLLVDVVGFFNSSVAPELTVGESQRHPILKVDAVKFINAFRNQLTKDQLRQALPLLVSLLEDSNPAVYTWSAVTIERILALRENSVPMFTEQDVRGPLPQLVGQLLKLVVANADSPEHLAANEFVMRCTMRVLAVAQGSCSMVAPSLLPDMIQIMVAISANPANPRFSHYLFESLAVLVKFGGVSMETLDSTVVQPSLQVLANDVTEFVPYILQVLTLILRLQPEKTGPGASLPPAFAQLVKPLLSPILWEPKGNVPALVELLQAILTVGASEVVNQGLVQPLLGVFQNLVASRANDHLGLELLEYVLVYIPGDVMAPYLAQIAQLLLVRLQTSRTTKFVAGFARFIYFVAAVEQSPSLGPEFAIKFIDQVQDGVFGQVWDTFVLPVTLKITGQADRRVAAVGLAKLLCEAPQMVTGNYVTKWAPSLKVLVELIRTNIAERPADEFLVEVDLQELSFGSTFSRLQACTFKPFDPVPSVSSPQQFFTVELQRLAAAQGPALAARLDLIDPASRDYLRDLGV